LDCQATGANPDKGRLLEIGWMACRLDMLSQNTPVHCYLIQQPAGHSIPPMVIRITGITEKDLRGAVTHETAWNDLLRTSQEVAACNRSNGCPMVIHFARFELPFLHQLHETNAPDTPFPFQIICTHAIALRLLPELPRRGLRALAGYFGVAVPELNRCSDHVRATVSIWSRLTGLLKDRCDVNTLQDLSVWMDATKPSRNIKRVFPMQDAHRRNLPDQPGIYRMRRTDGSILYIGKAKSLKQRVGSYFRSRAPHAEHILEMLTQARQLDFALTGSALEAAVLEADEIKHHRPPYNIALRGDRRCLAFGAKDLQHWSDCFSSTFCVGPLSSGRTVHALSAFSQWIDTNMALDDACLMRIGSAIFGAPFGDEVAPGILRDGLILFCHTHIHRLKQQAALRVITSLGAQLWRQKKISTDTLESAEVDNTEDLCQNEPVPQKKERTPGDIADAMEHILMHAAYMLRRARWFRLLMNSCLTWAPADDPDTLKHLVILKDGAVVECKNDSARTSLSMPAFGQGTKGLDLETYDRLRVITTEMRRLVNEGRRLELSLSSKIRLNNHRIAKALKWI
jgi:DNA polymerase-3 subunit epsilon